MSLEATLSNTSIRWHQRAVVRKWADVDNVDAPFLVTVSSNTDSAESASHVAARILLDSSPTETTVSLRVAAHVDDEYLTAIHDVEVRFDFSREQPPTDAELADMLGGWAMNVALGCIRGALSEASSAVGLPPLVLDPLHSFSGPDVDAIIARARATGAPHT